MYILALADDMTGALEIGAKFSATGIDTLVSAAPVPVGSAVVLVLDTETRHANPETARSEVQRFLNACGTLQPGLIYKKTDSTLRGNIRVELSAISELYRGWQIGYAPAYPAMGRTVIDGILYVHGRPVAETEFAMDALNPITSSSLEAVLGSGLPYTVFDGQTDDDLEAAARIILANSQMRIVAGPAGLAETLAATLDLPRGEPCPLPKIGTCVIMNGSRHERSAAQIRNFGAAGWQILSQDLEPDWNAVQVAFANAKYVLATIARDDPEAVFVIGGDTAFAVVRALGFPRLFPIADAVPGVPVTRIAAVDLKAAFPGRQRDLILITKAGGFGGYDVLNRVHAKLSDGHDR